MLLAVGLTGPSMGFAYEWAKGGCVNHCGIYLIMPSHVFYFSFVAQWYSQIVCAWIAFNAATAPGRESVKKDSDPAEVAPGAEPPSDSETHSCQPYRCQLLRGKYRLLADPRSTETTDTFMNIREYASIAHINGGVGVSVSLSLSLSLSLPSVPLCSLHHAAYTAHASSHTGSMMDCIDRGYRNVKERGKEISGCRNHMRTRLEFAGRNHNRAKQADYNIIIAPPKHSDFATSSRPWGGGR